MWDVILYSSIRLRRIQTLLIYILLEKANIIGNENVFIPIEPPTLTQPDVIFVLFG